MKVLTTTKKEPPPVPLQQTTKELLDTDKEGGRTGEGGIALTSSYLRGRHVGRTRTKPVHHLRVDGGLVTDTNSFPLKIR